jgi:hypothetical protein
VPVTCWTSPCAAIAVKEGAESCNDGGASDGDGCSASCALKSDDSCSQDAEGKSSGVGQTSIPAQGGTFGAGVAVAGDHMLVGSTTVFPLALSAGSWVADGSPSTAHYFSTSVGISGDFVVVGGQNASGASVYKRDGDGDWNAHSVLESGTTNSTTFG